MIHRALRLIRQFHEVKQVDLASDLGISKSYLSEIESGKKTVSYELILRYSERFDISASSLVFFAEAVANDKKLSQKIRATASGKILDMIQWMVEKRNGHEAA